MRTGTINVGHPVDVATGTIFSTYQDISIPGKVELIWERRYSTALLGKPSGPLGPGWTTRYFATLERTVGEYHLLTPEGDVEVFSDPTGEVERGAILRHLGTFQELAREDNTYVLTRWNMSGQEIERYLFREGTAGQPWLLATIERVGVQALDILRDDLGRVAGVSQRLERRTLHIAYTPTNRIEQITFLPPQGSAQVLVRYDYDNEGRLIAAHDALNRSERYEYDRSARIRREISRDGGVFEFKFDARGRCVKTSGLDRYDEKLLRYYEGPRMTEVTNSLGIVTRYKWLSSGQVTTIIDPLGGEDKTEYDEFGRIIAAISPVGTTKRQVYDDQGNRSKFIDQSGAEWSFTYNEHHQQTSLTDPMGRTWKRSYDRRGHLLSVEDPLGARFAYEWDGVGNLLEFRTPRGYRTRYGYDHRGVLTDKTTPANHTAHYTFDSLGRMTLCVTPTGHIFRVEYDVLGHILRLQFEDGTSKVFTYDTGGNMTSVTDQSGYTRRYLFGPCRRLLEKVSPLGTRVRYIWGSEPDRLESVVNENGESLLLFYDDLGRVIKQRFFDGRERSFQYDAAGRVIEMRNGAGEQLGFVWDPCDRLVERHLPGGVVEQLMFDPSGDIVRAATPDCIVRFERDAARRPVREIQDEFVIDSTYDVDGNRTSLATSLGHQVAFDINESGQVRNLRLPGGDSFSFFFNERGLEASRVVPGNFRLDQDYDATGRLFRQYLYEDSGAPPEVARLHAILRPIVGRVYHYAPNGTVVGIDDSRHGNFQYVYDPEQRLLQAFHREQAVENFRYDEAGNVTSMRSNGSADEFEYTAGGRLQRSGDTLFAYDGEGRLIRRVERTSAGGEAVWHFTWDGLGQLRSVQRPSGALWTYKYDLFGRRIAKQGPTSGIRFVWDADTVIHEISDRNQVTSWVFDQPTFSPIAKVVDREIYSIIPDHLGTPRELLSRSGRIVWSAQLSVWGRNLGPEATGVSCPVRFPGQWFDEESGLHYNRFRYYDPRSGRFLSQDPVAETGSLNFYRYAINPLNWIDPYGLDVCENREKGEKFKDDVKKRLTDAKFTVVEEVTVVVTTPTGETRTRVDLVVLDPSGKPTTYIETKASATAPYTDNQKAAGVGGGALVGPGEIRSERGGGVTKGATVPSGTPVQTIRPGDPIPGTGTTAPHP